MIKGNKAISSVKNSQVTGSVTRLGDLLDFGQLFKLPKNVGVLDKLIVDKDVKIYYFSSDIIFGQLF